MYGRPGPRVSHGNGSGTGVPRGSRGVAVVAGLAPAPDATGSAPALAVDGLGDFGGLRGTARGGTPGTGNCNAVGWSRAHGNARWRFWRGAGAGVSLALWLGNHAASPPPRGCEGALCNRSTPISSLPDFLWLNCCCFPLRPFPPRDACSTAGLSSAWIRPCHAGRGTRPPPPPPKAPEPPWVPVEPPRHPHPVPGWPGACLGFPSVSFGAVLGLQPGRGKQKQTLAGGVCTQGGNKKLGIRLWVKGGARP